MAHGLVSTHCAGDGTSPLGGTRLTAGGLSHLLHFTVVRARRGFTKQWRAVVRTTLVVAQQLTTASGQWLYNPCDCAIIDRWRRSLIVQQSLSIFEKVHWKPYVQQGLRQRFSHWLVSSGRPVWSESDRRNRSNAPGGILQTNIHTHKQKHTDNYFSKKGQIGSVTLRATKEQRVLSLGDTVLYWKVSLYILCRQYILSYISFNVFFI